MFRLRDISIRNKLILMQVFTSVLVLGIFFSVYVITDIKSYKQRKVNNITALARVIGSNSISALEFEDNEAAAKNISELQNATPEIIHGTILDKKGNVFASYSKKGANSIPIPASLDQKKFVFAGNHLFVSNDIINEKEISGKVILEVELSELAQIKQSKNKLAVILLIVALCFSFFVAIIIQRYISKRLLHLVNTMKEVSRTADYNKSIADDGKDEISTLVRVFNNLMIQVKQNQQRKDEFIDIASHELRTPLTSVKGYLDLLNIVEEKQPNKQFVEKSLSNVNKLDSLIKDLLDVSKIQSGRLKLNMSEFNMDTLADETISNMRMITGTHEIITEGSFNDEIIIADRLRIEQVLTNLISNAVKYSPGESKVIVYSYKTSKEIIVKVRDFGIGVPKEEQKNIFERFYRTKDMSNTISGFGLGLYICHDIVERHKGRIWVESESKGSAFYFSLPLKSMA